MSDDEMTIEQRRRELMDAVPRELLENIRTREDAFQHLRWTLTEISKVVGAAAQRGALSEREIAIFSASSVLGGALVRAMEHNPMFGSPAFTLQLENAYREVLKSAPMVEVKAFHGAVS